MVCIEDLLEVLHACCVDSGVCSCPSLFQSTVPLRSGRPTLRKILEKARLVKLDAFREKLHRSNSLLAKILDALLQLHDLKTVRLQVVESVRV